jgi:hypothetical protein
MVVASLFDDLHFSRRDDVTISTAIGAATSWMNGRATREK